MRRDDIINILCKLKFCNNEFSTMKTSFQYEFSDVNYEITLERDNGKLVKFEVKNLGEVQNEDN